ncbi:Pol I core factor CF [Apophysomyces ossiformis]|uniref:Pol I core factor CF n=1 Tax=Apophysomyces ossiformis TaxID=679940 RepID=A0A8H7BHE4_9FUNG|nr:Pol I core factor CF [Apophysomyces ossiformis]
MFEHVVREIWLSYISKTNTILTDAFAEEEYTSRPNRRRSIEDDLEEEDLYEETNTKDLGPQLKGTWPGLHFSHTIVFCYLACLWLRWPVMLNDIRRWCVTGQLPYARILKSLPKEFMQRIDMSTGETIYQIPPVLKIFRATEKYKYMFEACCNVTFPESNTPFLIYRCCKQFYLPVEMYFCITRLLEYYPKNRRILNRPNTFFAELPLIDLRIIISALITVKLCYVLDDDEDCNTVYDDIAFTPLMDKKEWLTNIRKNAERWKEMQEKNDVTSSSADLSLLIDFIRNVDVGDISKAGERITSNMAHNYLTKMSRMLGVDILLDPKQESVFMNPPSPAQFTERTNDPPRERPMGKTYHSYSNPSRYQAHPKEIFRKEYELLVDLAARISGFSFEEVHQELVRFELRLQRMMRQ